MLVVSLMRMANAQASLYIYYITHTIQANYNFTHALYHMSFSVERKIMMRVSLNSHGFT